MKAINEYWQKITTAQSDIQELNAVKALSVYLADQRIPYDVLGESGGDSLMNMATASAHYTPQNITMIFYPNGRQNPIEKQDWKPKNPKNAFYFFNE